MFKGAFCPLTLAKIEVKVKSLVTESINQWYNIHEQKDNIAWKTFSG